MDDNARACIHILNCVLTGGKCYYMQGKRKVYLQLLHVMSTPLEQLFEEWRDKLIYTDKPSLHDRTVYGVQAGDVWVDTNGVNRAIYAVFHREGTVQDFNRVTSKIDCLEHLRFRTGLKE